MTLEETKREAAKREKTIEERKKAIQEQARFCAFLATRVTKDINESAESLRFVGAAVNHSCAEKSDIKRLRRELAVLSKMLGYQI